jgi:hypothetical protein
MFYRNFSDAMRRRYLEGQEKKSECIQVWTKLVREGYTGSWADGRVRKIDDDSQVFSLYTQNCKNYGHKE